MSELTFRADAETLRILEKIGLDKKDDFINRAVKAYATAGGAFEYAAAKGGSGSPSLSAGLTGGFAAGLAAGSGNFAYSASTVNAGSTANSGSAASADIGSQLNAELERLLGENSGVSATLSPGNAQMVEFYNRGQKIASLELSECQSILKSLRPPISFAEVVEMLTLMSVG